MAVPLLGAGQTGGNLGPEPQMCFECKAPDLVIPSTNPTALPALAQSPKSGDRDPCAQPCLSSHNGPGQKSKILPFPSDSSSSTRAGSQRARPTSRRGFFTSQICQCSSQYTKNNKKIMSYPPPFPCPTPSFSNLAFNLTILPLNLIPNVRS